MTRFAALLLFMLLPYGALAGGPFPALYDVTGVAADDVLNLRAEPGAGAERLGALAADARDVEVVRLSEDGGWGLVNGETATGWASTRYLARQPGQDWGTMPDRFDCVGTEPFWLLTLAADGAARFGDILETAQTYPSGQRIDSASRPDRFVFVAGGSAGELTGVIARESCGDGMSEQEYGFALDLLLRRPGRTTFYTGCCTILP